MELWAEVVALAHGDAMKVRVALLTASFSGKRVVQTYGGIFPDEASAQEHVERMVGALNVLGIEIRERQHV